MTHQPPPPPFDPMDVLGDAAPAAGSVAKPPAPPLPLAGSEARPSRRTEATGPFLCASCNSRTVGRPYMPGSLLVEVLAWLLLLWPIAVFYSWWRRGPKRRECPICGGRDLVRA